MSGKKGQALATTAAAALPAATADFFHSRANQGMERVSMNDIVMPRVSILQSLSPQLKRNKPEFVEGAEEGMIFNTASRAISTTLLVIPCFYLRHHIEWRPNRGGFVADHGEAGEQLMRQTKRNEDNYDVLPNGNLLVPTPTWYCIDVATGKQIIIPMPRTQSKPSRQWMAMATSETIRHPEHGEFTPPLFFRAYTLSTVERQDGENDWYVWNAERGQTIIELPNGDELLAKATQFRDLLERGEIRADAAAFADDTNSDGGGGRRGGDDSAM